MKTNKFATVKRLTVTANPNIKDWQEVETISVMFIPLSQEMGQIASAQGIMGKAYNVYADATADIQETDRLVIDLLEYDVKGIKKYEGTHGVNHLEVLIEKRKQ